MNKCYWIIVSLRVVVVTGPADVKSLWESSFSSNHVASPSLLAFSAALTRSKALRAPLLFIIASGSLGSIPSTFKSSPFGTLSGTLSSSTVSSSPSLPFEAAINMAVLSIPRIFAGLRFVTATTLLPIILSKGIFPARPATTVRNSGLPSSERSPQSTLQTTRLSASGCGPASTIVAARNATRRTSSTGPASLLFC